MARLATEGKALLPKSNGESCASKTTQAPARWASWEERTRAPGPTPSQREARRTALLRRRRGSEGVRAGAASSKQTQRHRSGGNPVLWVSVSRVR